MNAESFQARPASVGHPSVDAQAEHLSALVDGEVLAGDLDWLLSALEADTQQQAACEHYHLIGDLVRGSAPVHGTAPHAFVAGVRARLQAVESPAAVPMPAVPNVVPAANDAVFRWKLVAGLASLAAVMAVSWSLLGVAPGAGGAGPGPQLAQAMPGAPTTAIVGAPAQAVLVNTAQGPVIRDARLEELLAEHRQFGGMSALQMPAGFLRDATYQSAPQR